MGMIEDNGNQEFTQITWLLEGSATIYLTQTDENGCSTTESLEVIITWPVEVEENIELDFSIYPNPFNEYTNININNTNGDYYDIYIYDMKGRIVKSFISETRNVILLEKEFNSGIYNVQLINSNTRKRKLIIVE